MKGYLRASQHNVQFVFSSNGHLFVEFDRSSGMTTAPRPISEFPSPADLRARYEKIMGFSLEEPIAKPLLTRYVGGEGQRGEGGLEEQAPVLPLVHVPALHHALPAAHRLVESRPDPARRVDPQSRTRVSSGERSSCAIETNCASRA